MNVSITYNTDILSCGYFKQIKILQLIANARYTIEQLVYLMIQNAKMNMKTGKRKKR